MSLKRRKKRMILRELKLANDARVAKTGKYATSDRNRILLGKPLSGGKVSPK